MAFTFSNMAAAIWSDLGKVAALENFLATSGSSATQIENTLIGTRDNQPEDDYARDFTAIVVRDAGGAAAAPEGQLQRISAYDSATYKYTVDTAFTVAVATGDEILIANSDIPLREMYRICNRALTEIGDISLVDTSLTTTADQAYTLPVALKREALRKVEYEDLTNSNLWYTISNWKYAPAVGGTGGTLYLPVLVSGLTIKLTYQGVHPTLTAYNSTVYEPIHPELAIAAGVKHAMRFILNANGGGSDFDKQRYNEASVAYEAAKAAHPIYQQARAPKYFVTSSHVNPSKYPPEPH